ncbi:MAG: ArsR family transcriptional regulator [Candidatus Altiarchaeales archaeon]|nr:ArsR family transcriptional regulator [Candidatus Altiarchaeales archaeon]
MFRSKNIQQKKMPIRITIQSIRKPINKNLDEDLRWLCSSLGFCNQKQKHTGNKVFTTLLKKNKKGVNPTSTELAEEIGMSRGAVIHQLNRLKETGLISKDGRSYRLRETNLTNTLKEMERDMKRLFEDLEDIAAELDEEIGFKTRQRR